MSVTYRDREAVAESLAILQEVARCYRVLMETFDPTTKIGEYDAADSHAYYRRQLVGIEHAIQIITSTQKARAA